MDKFVGKKRAMEMIGVSASTLIKMGESGEIDMIKTPGGHRKYNIDKYIRDNVKNNANENKIINPVQKKKLCYVRVSTLGQKDDLQRQKQYMTEKYPNHEIIEDIGSGINFNRKGLRKIIKMAVNGEVDELVVAYKDRLTRFGFDLINDMVRDYSNGRIIIENTTTGKEPREELVEDVLQILNVYTAKMNGLRKYHNMS